MPFRLLTSFDFLTYLKIDLKSMTESGKVAVPLIEFRFELKMKRLFIFIVFALCFNVYSKKSGKNIKWRFQHQIDAIALPWRYFCMTFNCAHQLRLRFQMLRLNYPRLNSKIHNFRCISHWTNRLRRWQMLFFARGFSFWLRKRPNYVSIVCKFVRCVAVKSKRQR